MTGSGKRDAVDFFISYTQVDLRWAEWITWKLEEVGFTTFLQTRDIRPGNDFIHEMQRASTRSAHTIAVISPSYRDVRVRWDGVACSHRHGSKRGRAAADTSPSR